MSTKPSKPVIAYTRRTPQGPVLSVSVDAAKLEDKSKRVRRPENSWGIIVTHHDSDDGLGPRRIKRPYVAVHRMYYQSPKQCRTIAAWLLRAAAWIEQQNGGKRGTKR